MNKTRIEFDGGTPCNIPAKGYGIGYGSYQINGNPVTRISHQIPCSNNAAEMLTLVAAFKHLNNTTCFHNSHIDVYGDSKIVLRWLDVASGAVIPTRKKQHPKGSPEFVSAYDQLKEVVSPWKGSVTSHWQPREHSVTTFGH